MSKQTSVKIVFLSLLCSFAAFFGISSFSDRQAVKAEPSQTNIYDIFDGDFFLAGTEGIEYWKPEGYTQILGDWGAETQVGIKFRMFVGIDAFDLSFTLSGDGATCTNRIPTALGGLFQVNFAKGEVVITYPGASDFFVGEKAYYENLKAGSTVAVEITLGELKDGAVPFRVVLDGNAVINADLGPAYGDYLGKAGTKVIISGGQNLIIESSEKTCVHEKSEWSAPNEDGEIFITCKHCGLELERSYYSEVVDLSAVAGKNAVLLEGDGVIGSLGKTAFVGMSSKLYLPDNVAFEFYFSVLGNGERLAVTGRYYGAVEYVIRNGSLSVLDLLGQNIKSVALGDLTPGKEVALEFGVYAAKADLTAYYIKVNGTLILTGESDSEGIGSYCAYYATEPALMESSAASCEHKAEKTGTSDGKGFIQTRCTVCGTVLYKIPEQTTYDISEFTHGSSYEVVSGDPFLFNVGKEQCVGVKGLIYIPAEVPANFQITLTVMTDTWSTAWSGNGYREGLYSFIIRNNTLVFTIPWAAHFFSAQSITSGALKRGSTFAFEYGVYQITDSPSVRYAYFILNGEKVIENRYSDQNYPLDTYFLIQSTADIMLFEDSACTSGTHKLNAEWSAPNEDFVQKRVCVNCGKTLWQREIPSTVSFRANYAGMVTLSDVQAYGKTFTYNVPNAIGYKITDIKANGVSVFGGARELPSGYEITVTRNALDIEISAVYEAKSYSVNYVYNKDAAVTIENNGVGYGGTAKYVIKVKNGKDVVGAKIGGTEYLDKLEVTEGGYILTVNNVKEDISLTLEMDKKQYNVTVRDSEGGFLTAGKTKVDAFGTVKITATMQSGYYLAYFIVNGEKTSSNSDVLTLTDVTEDIAVSAVYVKPETETQKEEDSAAEKRGCGGQLYCGCVLFVLLGLGFVCIGKIRKEEKM